MANPKPSTTPPKTNTSSSTPVPEHHHVRTFFSALFGFIAIGLIVSSILVVWLDRTLTNTDQFVKTVAPLVTQPAVQNFVVEKASSGLLDNADAPVKDVATQLLGEQQVAGKTDEQLKAEITPIIKSSLQSVVSSPAFATLWVNGNREIHRQLITQLNTNSSTIRLDFHPVIVGTIDQLGGTKLSFVKDKLEIKPDMGVVVLRGDQLQTVHTSYGYFKKAMAALLACALFSLILSIVISVHHAKTIRRIAFATGLYCAFLALMLSATSLIKFGGAGDDAAMKQFAVTLVNSLTYNLRLTLIVTAVVCIVGSLASKFYSSHMQKSKLAPSRS